MKLIRIAILIGVIVAVPLCMLIYLSVANLEKAVDQSKEFLELADTITSLESLIDEQLIESSDETPAFPVVMRITNQKHQSLDVAVTGRTEEVLHFLSIRDNMHYFYPINGLSAADRIIVAGLPLWVPEEGRFPLPRQLRDGIGRPLVTMIEGRSEDEVFFRNLADGELHAYPIHRLSQGDRVYVLGLPVSVKRSGGTRTRRSQLEGSYLDPSGSLNTHDR